MPAGFRAPKRVVEHQDQRLLFIVAASRRSVHLRGLVGRRSQTLETLDVEDEGATPFSTALVLQRGVCCRTALGSSLERWCVMQPRAQPLVRCFGPGRSAYLGTCAACWTLSLPPSSHLVRTLSLLFFDLSCGCRSFSVCLSEEGARIPVNTPVSRLPLHSIPGGPSQLQRSEPESFQLLPPTL
jgi:hypothetical protein